MQTINIIDTGIKHTLYTLGTQRVGNNSNVKHIFIFFIAFRIKKRLF